MDALARLAAAAGLQVDLTPRLAAVDLESADAMLTQVLELAESLPYRPRGELEYPNLRDRLSGLAHVR